jgi:hypothetical protein
MPLLLLLLFHPECFLEPAINQGHHTHSENAELLANQSPNIKLNITAEWVALFLQILELLDANSGPQIGCPKVFCIVTWSLKAGIVKPEKTSIARQRLGKHFCDNGYASNDRGNTVFDVIHAEVIYCAPMGPGQCKWGAAQLPELSDNIIWQRVPRNSELRMTVLARTSSSLSNWPGLCKLESWVPQGPQPRITVLAKSSSNLPAQLTDRTALGMASSNLSNWPGQSV